MGKPRKHTGIPKVMGSTTLTIKCQLDGSDLRRRTVELPSSGLTLASLNSVVRELFQQSDTTTFKVVYTDEDGDAITIGCDADVAEAVRCATVSGKPMLRLRASSEVPAPTPTPQAPAPKPAAPASEPTAPNQTAPGFGMFDMMRGFQQMASSFANQSQQTPSNTPRQGGFNMCDMMRGMQQVAPMVQQLQTEFEKHKPEIEKQVQHMATEFEKHRPEIEKQTKKAFEQMNTPEFKQHAPNLVNQMQQMFQGHCNTTAEATMPDAAVHYGFQCDVTGMSPIVGTRYKKINEDYHLCQEAFNKLSEEEAQQFVHIDTPAQAAEIKQQEAQAEQALIADLLSSLRVDVVDVIDANQTLEDALGVSQLTGDEPITVMGDRGIQYLVSRCSCSCPDWRYRRSKTGASCKHMKRTFGKASAQEEESTHSWVTVGDTSSPYTNRHGQPRGSVPVTAPWLGRAEATMLTLDHDSYTESGVTDPERASEEDIATPQAGLEHPGIWCDECNMKPIRGARYMKQMQLDTFDLCKGCYNALSESDQSEFKVIEPVEPAAAMHVEQAEATLKAAEEEAEAAQKAAEDAEAAQKAAEAAAALKAEEAAAEFARLAAVEEAKAEACRLAVERVAAKAAAEEAEAARVAAEAEEAARVKEEEAAAAARASKAKAVETAQGPVVPIEWQAAVDALVQMGFSESVAKVQVVGADGDLEAALEAALSFVHAANGEVADATRKLRDAQDALQIADLAVLTAAALEKAELAQAKAEQGFVVPPPQPSWDYKWDSTLEELVEMGFEDAEANKRFVMANDGDLKSTVTALVADERSKR